MSTKAREKLESAAGMTHPAGLFPPGLPCPYLTSKQFAAGAANMTLSFAPLLEMPSKFLHFPLNVIGPSYMCPYMVAKGGVEEVARAGNDKNVKIE